MVKFICNTSVKTYEGIGFMEYRYGSHTVFKIQYYFVFVTKYRYGALKGDVDLHVSEPIRHMCNVFEVEI